MADPLTLYIRSTTERETGSRFLRWIAAKISKIDFAGHFYKSFQANAQVRLFKQQKKPKDEDVHGPGGHPDLFADILEGIAGPTSSSDD